MLEITKCILYAVFVLLFTQGALAKKIVNIEGVSYRSYSISVLIDRIGCRNSGSAAETRKTGIFKPDCVSSRSLTGENVAFTALTAYARSGGYSIEGLGSNFDAVGNTDVVDVFYDALLRNGESGVVIRGSDQVIARLYEKADDFQCSIDNGDYVCHILVWGRVKSASGFQYVEIDGFFIFDTSSRWELLFSGVAGVADVIDLLN